MSQLLLLLLLLPLLVLVLLLQLQRTFPRLYFSVYDPKTDLSLPCRLHAVLPVHGQVGPFASRVLC